MSDNPDKQLDDAHTQLQDAQPRQGVINDVVDIMARTIWGEARGENELVRRAVANVIVNRAEHPRWWGKSVVDVCQHPYQFSCWNADDPNRAKLLAVTDDDTDFVACKQVARDAIRHTYPDPTNNSDSYYDTSIPEPLWAQGLALRYDTGRMRFYGVELKRSQ